MMARDKISESTLVTLWRGGIPTVEIAKCYCMTTLMLNVRWGRLVSGHRLPKGPRAADVPFMSRGQIREKIRRHRASAAA